MALNENVQWLYDNLKGKGIDLGTPDEFNTALSSDKATQDWAYKKGKEFGYDLGSQDEFLTGMGIRSSQAVHQSQEQRNVSVTSANPTFSGGQYAFIPAAARANQQQVEQEESKRQALQRQAAATLPTTQQDRQTAAEIQRLGAEATLGKPNGVSFGIDPKTGLPTITKSEGNGVHLYTGEKLANQD